MKKIFNYALHAIVVSLMVVTVACTDEKDEANAENSSSTENTSNPSNPSGGLGTQGSGSQGSGTSGTYNLAKGEAQMVDLGLPSGTKWADRNIGATSPEDYGAYFAWGEISPKDYYKWSTYLDGRISSYYDYSTEKDAMKGITDIAGNATYDAATANWGTGYKMPTKAQWSELSNSSYTTWTWCDGVNEKYNNTTAKGCKVKSKANGNSIFLPAAGARSGSDNYYAGSDGVYWSSSLDLYWSSSNDQSGPTNAWCMHIHSPGRGVGDGGRSSGLSVRAVSEKSE